MCVVYTISEFLESNVINLNFRNVAFTRSYRMLSKIQVAPRSWNLVLELVIIFSYYLSPARPQNDTHGGVSVLLARQYPRRDPPRPSQVAAEASELPLDTSGVEESGAPSGFSSEVTGFDSETDQGETDANNDE